MEFVDTLHERKVRVALRLHIEETHSHNMGRQRSGREFGIVFASDNMLLGKTKTAL